MCDNKFFSNHIYLTNITTKKCAYQLKVADETNIT